MMLARCVHSASMALRLLSTLLLLAIGFILGALYVSWTSPQASMKLLDEVEAGVVHEQPSLFPPSQPFPVALADSLSNLLPSPPYHVQDLADMALSPPSSLDSSLVDSTPDSPPLISSPPPSISLSPPLLMPPSPMLILSPPPPPPVLSPPSVLSVLEKVILAAEESTAKEAKPARHSSGPPAFDPSERYLYYPRAGEWCAGASHHKWSLSCMIGEAIALNRTLVLDMERCIIGVHNNGKTVVQDIRLYYNLDAMKEAVRITPMHEFLEEWKDWKWKVTHERDGGALRMGRLLWPLTKDLVHSNATVVQRSYTEKENYAYEVCDTNKEIKRNWNGWSESVPVRDLARLVKAKLGPEYNAVHVRRGDKVRDKWRWKHLDEDTRPPKLLKTLQAKMPATLPLYIATDERSPGFFAPLATVYKIFVVDDFKALWSKGSPWWEGCQRLVGPGKSFQMDGVLLGMVDYEILAGAKKRLETFNDLTTDNKHG
eukprot:TRINITY_DN7816_c0_g1_i3.p1 TRINITY_DN7816_c0_g1~~TRINITY_DN7816_c0_g1_i3.p1  ORF type:complete len:486 (-),score=85.92 TRINITY_DN7816_c0_g1_i3:289-1746(-)